jgi:hypothetical protein
MQNRAHMALAAKILADTPGGNRRHNTGRTYGAPRLRRNAHGEVWTPGESVETTQVCRNPTLAESGLRVKRVTTPDGETFEPNATYEHKKVPDWVGQTVRSIPL